jgi:CRISPR-associated protein Cmr3
MLPKGDAARKPGEKRKAWRDRVRQLGPYQCHLVAASVPKPVPITGWSERLRANEAEANSDQLNKGARATRLAVPAGAVYYFEGEDAALLADALSWHGKDRTSPTIQHRRSALCGEQGFGIGVCGPWDWHDASIAEAPPSGKPTP